MEQTTTPNNAPNVLYMLSAEDFKQVLKDFVLQIMEEQKQNEVQNDFITKDEVCKLLHTTTTTLYTWEKKEYLIPKRMGKRVFYSMNDIKRVMNERSNNG